MFAKNVAHRDRLFMQNFSASSNSPLRDYFSLSLSLFPSNQINNQALCVPTGNDPYSPIIRSRLQPFDAGAPQERAREGKREISSADLCPYHGCAREPTLTDHYCMRGARMKTHDNARIPA